MEFEFLFKWLRNCISVLAWAWAVLVFVIGYYGNDFENNNERQPGFRHVFVPIVKVLVVAPSMCSLGAGAGRIGRPQRGLNEPGNVQYMAMNHDGQYSFAYSGADSSRQERRNSDGSVDGAYSYTSPEGKLVEVKYQADAAHGFTAYGENLPLRNTLVAPYPVQDTEAVREARDRFMQTYARELARIKAGQKAEVKQLTPSLSPQPLDDSEVVVSAQSDTTSEKDPPAQYHGVTRSQQSGPAYFYYVGVGGLPYYLTSPTPTNTNIAVSVRASQLGALPVAAVHDAQVPRYGHINAGTRKTQFSPPLPLYVEVGKDYELPSAHPTFTYVQQQAPKTQATTSSMFNMPYLGYPVYIIQN